MESGTRTMMTVEALASHVSGARVRGDGTAEVARVVHDSRQVRAGDLFVALPGTKVDGHRFVQAALDAGAVAAVVEREPALPGDPALVVVPDARAALGLAAHALAGDPSRKLRVVGITGTNGKTTTTYLARGVLEAAGRRTGLVGTIAHLIGDRRIPSRMTTPDAPDLAGYFAEMVGVGLEAAVMEVSSHALDQRRTAGIAFDVAALTNLTPEHLDYHKDLPGYRAAKARLFAGLGPEAWAVLNADDDEVTAFRAASATDRVLLYGLERPADVHAEAVEATIAGSRFRLVTPRGKIEARTPLLGRHNVMNALAAAAIGVALEIEPEAIARGIASVGRVRGRLERVPTERPITVLVDYAHTADALRKALETVGEVAGEGRILVAFGCGGDRDRSKRPAMAREAERGADRVIVTSDNPRSEDPAAIADEVMAGFRDPAAVLVELDRRAAIARTVSEARPGDVVLIAGKGHETYQETREGTIDFDDREVAREILEAG